MRIAVDLSHPAHFHFFRNAIETWKMQGHDVLILAREKDLTLPLLDETGWPYQCLSRARQGKSGLAIELVEHGSKAWRLLGKHRCQVAVAVSGAFIAYAARLRGIPLLVYYDTEHAKIANKISYPLATRIFTPRAYQQDLGAKHERYNGYQELAYLHPSRFKPDPAALAVEGLQPGEPFTFVRLVSWTSHHDTHDFGVTNLHEVVRRLEKYGRVLISAESPLPDDLKDYARKGRHGDVHHVLGFARLFFGESATMASEAAQLGVPGIFLSTSSRGYTDEQEKQYQMVFNFNGERARQELALKCAEEILADPETPRLFRQRHDRMMQEVIDVTALVLESVQKYARQ